MQAVTPSFSLKEALQFIESECFSFEVREEEWESERSTLNLRIKVLESDKERQNYIIAHQARRIEMLENALNAERNLKGQKNYTGGDSELSKSLDKFTASRTQQQQTVQSLVTELHQVSSELSSILEINTRDIAALEDLIIPTKSSKQPKTGSVIYSQSSGNAETSKPIITEPEPELLLDFLKKRSSSKTTDASKPVPTILDMLSPPNSERDGSHIDATTPRASSFEKVKSRRSTSDNSVRLQETDKDKKTGKESQKVLDSLVHALEDDDSFLDSSFEKNYSTWKQTSTVRAHFDSIRSMQFHQELPVLLTASDDCTLKLWNVDAATKKVHADSFHTYYGHKKAVLHCTMDYIGKYIYSSSLDNTIMQWKLPSELVNPNPFESYGKAISHHVHTFTGHTDAVWDVCTHETNANVLFSASSDGSVKIWNPRKRKQSSSCIQTLLHTSGDTGIIPTSLCVVNTNKNHLLVSYNNSSISVVDIETFKVVQQMEPAEATGKPDRSTQINQIVNHACRPLAFTAHEDRYIRYFDLRSGECSHSMVGHLESVSTLAVDPRGEHLLSGGHDCSLRVWDIRKKTCTQELMANRKKFDESIECVTCHPKLNLIASSGADSNIKFLKQNLPISTVP